MTIQTYRKRPVTIEALQWTGDNARDLAQWCGWCFNTSALGHARIFVDANDVWLDIERSEWIAKDRHGFYPIKDDVFLETYEKVERDIDE